MIDDPQRTLGKYQILGELGKGAMGVVYRGFDPSLEREVALKVMASAIVTDGELKERFEREAKAVARLQHPNIVTVYDLGYDERGAPYIAMELLKGQDLEHRIRRDPLTLKEKLWVMEQVCRGLATAHRNGIVHRDIKPANIFITASGEAKIMDFGVARWQQSSHTQTGAVLGTADYMSPEQIRGDRVDGRSDIFSVGVILYRLLTNKKPFSGENIQAVFFKVLNQKPPSIVLPEGNDMPELQEIVDKALSKTAEDRYAEASDLADDIRDLMNLYREVLTEKTVFETIFDPTGPGDAPSQPDALPRPTSGGRILGATSPGGVSRTHGPSGAFPPPTARGNATEPGVARTRSAPMGPARRSAAAGGAEGAVERRRGAGVGIPLERSRGRGRLAAAVAFVALFAGGAFWWLDRPSAPAAPTTNAALAAPTLAERFARAEDAIAKELYSLASNEVQEILLDDPGNERARELQARIVRLGAEPAPTTPTTAVEPHPGPAPPPPVDANAGARSNAARAAELAADASLAIGSGQLARAEQLIRDGRELDPENGRWTRLTEQIVRARDAADRATEMRERQAAVDRYVLQASALMMNKEYEAAIAAYDEALALDATNTQVLALKTNAMMAANLEQQRQAAAVLEFSESHTEYIAAGGGDEAPRGFEAGGVQVTRATQAAENPAELLVQIVPRTVQPGDPYVIRVRVNNAGNRPIGIKSLELVTVYGERTTGRGQILSPRVQRIDARDQSVIFEADGFWTEEQNQGSIEAVVTLVGDAKLRKTIQWK